MHTATIARTVELLTPQDAANRLLEEATRQNLCSGGIEGLAPVRVGKSLMFRPQDVESFIRANTFGGA